MSSLSSLRHSPSDSPTPFRKTKSAVLAKRKGPSPVKPTSRNVSPLKLALQRAHAKALHLAAPTPPPKAKASGSPLKNSLVKKGMRNVFAPPSPTNKVKGLQVPVTTVPPVPRIDPSRYQGGRRAPGMSAAPPTIIAPSDVPGDLQAVLHGIGEHLPLAASSPALTSALGLPLPPPENRVTPRRPGHLPPPPLSLPPVPNMPLEEAAGGRISPLPPQISLEFTRGHKKGSVFSDVLTASGENWRKSFDFTSEYAALDQGDQRASFVAALHSAGEYGSRSGEMDPVESRMALNDSSSASSQQGGSSESVISHGGSEMTRDANVVCEDDDSGSDTVEKQPGRKTPFKGQFAFQQRVLENKDTEESFPAKAPLPAPAAETRQERTHMRPSHNRGESGVSIATMSSIGDRIETDIAGDYTNHFEVNFASHLAAQQSAKHTSQSSLTSSTGDRKPTLSRESMISTSSIGSRRGRAPTWRNHHRRSSSILSVDSLGDLELLTGMSGVRQ